MPRWGMTIDLSRCSGCQACAVACKDENNVPFATQQELESGRGIFWLQMATQTQGKWPHVEQQSVPLPCVQCDNPPCTKVCPVDATHKDSEGLVQQNSARCIGSRYCAQNCPYTVRFFNWSRPSFPEAFAHYRSPDVAVRPKGVMEKCTFCAHRVKAAEDKAHRQGRRELRDGEVVPACAEVCPGQAITFGDLDNPDSRVAELSRSPRASRVLEELGTEPKVFHLRDMKREPVWRDAGESEKADSDD